MPELEAWAIGARGAHRDLRDTSPDNAQRESGDTDTVDLPHETEDKDEAAPGSLEWKESP